MNTSIRIPKQKSISGTIHNLPASKSISNRVLIMDALCDKKSQLDNLSTANDTELMQRLLASESEVIDTEDAGTTMRFLTAFFAVSGKRKLLTGTERMKQRPIGLLVDALRTIGAAIGYVEKDGFPPLQIDSFTRQTSNTVHIRGDVSSQYISALLMIAPVLPQGLVLNFEGTLTSKPYVEMTLALMKQFGIHVLRTENAIHVPHQQYTPTSLRVEADWSAASYWFAFTALADDATITLPNVTLRSVQGDRVIMSMMESLGVMAEPRGQDLILKKKDHQQTFSADFSDCPDLAQTIAVVCAAKKITATFKGLQSLRIKETDRIKALQTELAKLNCEFRETSYGWELKPGVSSLPAEVSINTYLDHRMAMAFAPLATQCHIIIENPLVVRKSYPEFWNDMQRVGFKPSISEG